MSRIEELRKGVTLKPEVMKDLTKKYDIIDKGALSVSTLLKNKIEAGAKKIKFHNDNENTMRHNNLFKTNQSFLYKELDGKVNHDQLSPDKTESTQFWSSIWSESKEHNDKATWLPKVREQMSNVKQQEEMSITTEDVKKRIQRLSNWKAPGPDGVQGYWFKAFPSMHNSIAKSLQSCLNNGNVPDWMVKGRTVLIQKDATKGNIVSNYRPIACLPLMWKIFSGIFADKIYEHLMDNNCLPCEQKGGRRKTRGTKDHLLLDKFIMNEVKRNRKGVAMAWVDYKKPMTWCPTHG